MVWKIKIVFYKIAIDINMPYKAIKGKIFIFNLSHHVALEERQRRCIV